MGNGTGSKLRFEDLPKLPSEFLRSGFLPSPDGSELYLCPTKVLALRGRAFSQVAPLQPCREGHQHTLFVGIHTITIRPCIPPVRYWNCSTCRHTKNVGRNKFARISVSSAVLVVVIIIFIFRIWKSTSVLKVNFYEQREFFWILLSTLLLYFQS